MWQSCAPMKNETIILPHIELAAIRWGMEDKPLILALHGWLDNAMSFKPLAEQLQQNYQILAVEWPGHGYSQHRPGQYPLQWCDYLFDLHCLLQWFGMNQPSAIMGHSLGAIIASSYNAIYPKQFNKMILIDGLFPLQEEAQLNKDRLQKSFSGHYKNLLKQSQLRRYRSLESLVNARHKLTGLNAELCELILARNIKNDDIGSYLATDPRLKLDSPLRLTAEQVDNFMQVTDTPTLAITAKGLSEQQELLMRQRFNYLAHRVIEGDHHLHMTSAVNTAKLVNSFIANGD